MKIKLKKEGGFMGMCTNTDVEMEKLSDSEREILTEMVSNLPQKKEIKKNEDHPESNTSTTMPTPGDIQVQDRGMYIRDSVSYEVKVKKGSRYVTFKFDDKSIPQKVYDLFQKYT